MSNISNKDKTILLAEHFGWKGPKHPDTIKSMEGWISKDWETWCLDPDGKHNFVHNMPRYFEDSAVIAKAKLSLTDEQKLAFVDCLCWILGVGKYYRVLTCGYKTYSIGAKDVFAISSATPEQEAEALGLILGLWS